MPTKQIFRSLMIGAVLLALSGCYAPYGAYPPPGYPPAGTTMSPAAIPQSTFVMPGDTSGSPASQLGTPGSTFSPSGQIQAPDPTTSSPTRGSESPVPPPRDPSADASPAGIQNSSLQPGGLDVALGEPAELDFKSPIMFTGGEQPVESGVIPASGAVAPSSQMGFDPEYKWFQGRLEFDAADRQWHLTYDESPGAFDQLGGDITLSSDVQLDAQHNGSLVRVTGEFDASKLDRLQKPIFRVSRIDPL